MSLLGPNLEALIGGKTNEAALKHRLGLPPIGTLGSSCMEGPRGRRFCFRHSKPGGPGNLKILCRLWAGLMFRLGYHRHMLSQASICTMLVLADGDPDSDASPATCPIVSIIASSSQYGRPRRSGACHSMFTGKRCE